MDLAGLMADTGKDMGHGQQQGALIVTDDAANPIAQSFDGLKHPALQGTVICRQYGRHLQHQAELQFPRHIQGRVAFLGLESVNGQKDPMPTEVGGVLFPPQVVSTAQ